MMSDGVLQALGESDNEEKMTAFLQNSPIISPQELANAILNNAMASSHYQAEDDMTVLVCGLYQKTTGF
jgi:serine phosphatase RsbU (regulator of sigma subunit)